MHSKWQAVIDKNRALARELGISGTPGFVVGNELVSGAWSIGFEWAERINCASGTGEMMDCWQCLITLGDQRMEESVPEK